MKYSAINTNNINLRGSKMAFNVDQFRNAMVFDGARPNLFQVTLQFPPTVNNGTNSRSIRFMANATQLPSSVIGVARQSYFGREVKFPGNRMFQDWSINVINDETFYLRNSFEQWLNLINNNRQNIRDSRAIYSSEYSVDAQVTQFSKEGEPIKKYNFVGLFPTTVDPIQLNWAQNDQIEEFGVTFTYQYWESVLDNATLDAPNSSIASNF